MDGELDNVGETAFYMVGGPEEILNKQKRLAEEAEVWPTKLFHNLKFSNGNICFVKKKFKKVLLRLGFQTLFWMWHYFT